MEGVSLVSDNSLREATWLESVIDSLRRGYLYAAAGNYGFVALQWSPSFIGTEKGNI